LRARAAERHATRGFPLASLFLLVTVCAALISFILPVAHAFRTQQVPGTDLLIASLIAGVVTTILGAFLGLLQRRPVLGLLAGGVVGGFVGCIVGPLCLLPVEQFAELLRMSLVGSLALVVLAAFMRRV